MSKNDHPSHFHKRDDDIFIFFYFCQNSDDNVSVTSFINICHDLGYSAEGALNDRWAGLKGSPGTE